MQTQKILVLGIGNILLKDEGTGVYVIEYLEKKYLFSQNVTLLDGGTLGMKLLEPISRADKLIVVDTIDWGLEPGTIRLVSYAELKPQLAGKNTLHQVGLQETIGYAEMMGALPAETRIVGIQPADITPWGTKLDERIVDNFYPLCTLTLTEIEKAGGSFIPKAEAVELTQVKENLLRLKAPQYAHAG